MLHRPDAPFRVQRLVEPPPSASLSPTAQGLARVDADWDALADRLGASPFQRPGWIRAWWRAFGSGRLEILTASRGEVLEAVLPVVRRPARTSSPTNWHTPAFGPLRADHRAGWELLTDLFTLRSHTVSVAFLSVAGPHIGELRTVAEANGYSVRVRRLQRSPAVVVRGDWSAYEHSLSADFRRDLARRERRLRELDDVSIEINEDDTGLAASLAEAFAIERLGWKGRSNNAISSRPATATFYAEIARWAARRGTLRLIFLRLRERPIAFHLAIEEGGAYFPLKGGFDPAYRSYSPGQLLIKATLQRAFTMRLERYEFLGDNEAYKRRWATEETDLMLFQAFAPTLTGRASSAAFAYGRPLAKVLLAAASRPRAGKSQRNR